MKTCRKCSADKPLSEFYKRSSNKDGFDNTCKSCVLKDAAEKHAASPSKNIARAIAWAKANPERKRALNSAWAKANPEKVQANISKPRPGRSKARWAANPKKMAAYSTEWANANPESIRMYRRNRRARKLSAGGRLSKGLAEKLFDLQRGMCPCCALPLGGTYHLDHIQPLSLGGSNTDENMQLLRATCNLQKSKKEPITFMQSRGFLL